MNKGIIGALVAVVVVVGGGYYLWSQGGMPGKETDPTTSFRELAASQSPQECTFTAPNGGVGTLFVSGGKIRGDFTGSLGGGTTTGHIIMRDNMSYIWAEGMTQGFKNSFAEATSTGESPAAGPDDRVTTDCKSWTADESKFELPQSVTFNTVSSMQIRAGASEAGSSAGVNATCSQCDMIPNDEAKKQCRAALNC